MPLFGRIQNDTVQEIIDFNPEGYFTPELVATFQVVPDGTAAGSTCNEDGTFTPPPPIDPPPPPQPVVPSQVTRWQAMQQMLATPSFVHAAPATVFTDMQALVTTAGGAIQLAWQNQQYVYRHGPFMAGVMAPLGLTDEAIDAMFIGAADLPL